MGLSSSKDVGDGSTSPPRPRGAAARVFQSSCFGGSSHSSHLDHQVSVFQDKENDKLRKGMHIGQVGAKCNHVKYKSCGKINASEYNGALDGRGQQCAPCMDSSGERSSSQMPPTKFVNRLRRSRSLFRFIPESMSFRLSRAASLGSSASRSLFSANVSVQNSDQLPVQIETNNLDDRNEFDNLDDRIESHQGNNHLSACSNLPTTIHNEYASSALSHEEPPLFGLATNLRDEEPLVSAHSQHCGDIVSSEDATNTNVRMRIGVSYDGYSHRNHSVLENIENRCFDGRRAVVQEPLEGGVRFSRTMSVGRLRDRVLRRTQSSNRFSHHRDDIVVGEIRQANGGQLLRSMTRIESSAENSSMLPSSSGQHLSGMHSSVSDIQDFEADGPQMGEAQNHNLVEHRAAFLERRRRIRSQFRALQRLGSRFENLSGHDRSCILSGQHRTGHCMCRASDRAAGPEDTSTSASISRIVMLAEALFEVLDEIHQQSVVLSTRSSLSSIGSVPAPKDIVDCMPVKIYTKQPKQHIEEAARCYICLVEYDEGDCMRILPCNHDFHQHCVDKWLKEIHRVCPLCRGDVCQNDMQHSK